MSAPPDEERNESWLSAALAGACLGIFFAVCACLPLIAPNGIADLIRWP